MRDQNEIIKLQSHTVRERQTQTAERDSRETEQRGRRKKKVTPDILWATYM
jgi:hypothetical protein